MAGGAFKKRAGRASARKSPSAKEPSDFDVNASVLAMIPPIGAIIDYYRTDATIDLPDNWQVCDGAVISDSRSSMVGDNTPDLRGKFSRGKEDMSVMGSDSGGVDTVDLYHSHTVNSHTHGPGTLNFRIFYYDNAINRYYSYNSGGGSTQFCATELICQSGTGFSPLTWSEWTSNQYYYTGPATGVTDSSAPGTDDALSHTSENRPAYIGLIKIMRIF